MFIVDRLVQFEYSRIAIGHFIIPFDILDIEGHSAHGTFETAFMPELKRECDEQEPPDAPSEK